MLDDRTIEACQTILNSLFPGINGFQATVLRQGDISFMPIAKDIICFRYFLRVKINVGIGLLYQH